MHQWIKNSIWVVLFKFENRIWKLKMYNKDEKEKNTMYTIAINQKQNKRHMGMRRHCR